MQDANCSYRFLNKLVLVGGVMKAKFEKFSSEGAKTVPIGLAELKEIQARRELSNATLHDFLNATSVSEAILMLEHHQPASAIA
jgi:hypothetical protein